jgi:NAD(P)-dependent dehydrogenase (short-subunit alcohol dehydrogenase family)
MRRPGSIAGSFGTEPLDEVRRLVDVDVLGYVHGRAPLSACSRARERVAGQRVVGARDAPEPAGAAVRDVQVRDRRVTRALAAPTAGSTGIHVGLVLPGPVDTPLFAHAANHTSHQLRAIPPACSPERVAAAVVRCVRGRRCEVPAGVMAGLVVHGRQVAPALADWTVATWSGRLIERRRTPAPSTSGALFSAPTHGSMSGGWRLVPWRRELGDRVGRVLARR